MTIQIPFLLVALSVVFGGMTGALHAMRKKMDVFGTAFVGVVTALGAGVLRDLAVGRVPVFLYTDLLVFALLGAAGGYLLGRFLRYLNRPVFVVDTLLIGVWVVLGCETALAFGLHPIAAVFVGAVSAIGGGVLRDLLCRDRPTAFSPVQFEAASVVAAAIVFVSIEAAVDDRAFSEVGALVTATGLRMLAYRYRWHSMQAVALSELIRGRRTAYDPLTGTLTRITGTNSDDLPAGWLR